MEDLDKHFMGRQLVPESPATSCTTQMNCEHKSENLVSPESLRPMRICKTMKALTDLDLVNWSWVGRGEVRRNTQGRRRRGQDMIKTNPRRLDVQYVQF